MNKPFFSIIIPTYNRADTIQRCLDSVVKQTYTNWEAIIIDNYSEDTTEEIVSRFIDKRIRYFKNHNYGIISISRNFGIDRAKGDWICFLDSDDSWKIDKLEQLLPYVGNYDLIYHGFIKNGGSKTFIPRNKILFYTVKESNIPYVLQRSDPFATSCTAVSRAFLSDTRFSEAKELFAIEDYDFFLQLLARSPRIKHLKKYLAFYDATTGISHNDFIQLNRNKIIINKYKDILSKKEFRNVLKLYMYTKGLAYLNIDKIKARKYFRAGFSSDILFVKWRAFVGYFLTFFN